MNSNATALPVTPDNNIKKILEGLAFAHERAEQNPTVHLLQHLQLLRETPIHNATRQRVLELIYTQCERTVLAEFPRFHHTTLPVSREVRVRVHRLLNLLAGLTQDYFNTLAELFDPHPSPSAPNTPVIALRRIMQCVAWQIQINHLTAAPPTPGLWQQLHAAYRSARKLGVEKRASVRNTKSIHSIYVSIVLAAIAEPASFNADEIEFIGDYVEKACPIPDFSEFPLRGEGIFWIDPELDIPAHALARRPPSQGEDILYFACNTLTALVRQHLQELENGHDALHLGLPEYAETRTGKTVLRRLLSLWGNPQKRRFSRRRNSFRVQLWAGFENLWHLARSPGNEVESSEWMITDESPDGYALMHVKGPTRHLRVGDVVTLRTHDNDPSHRPIWQICLVRRALSENPEHIELGVQLIASRATAAEIAQPSIGSPNNATALLLPAAPPLRPNESLLLPTGCLRDENAKIIVMIERNNLEIREIRTTRLDEQTSSIEMFSVLPDES